MNVDLVVSLGRVDGKRGQAYLAGALAAHMRRSAEAGGDKHEDAAGSLENSLLDTLCSIRALNASRAGRVELGEAAQEAGESILRLIHQLRELTEEALGS